MSRGVSVPLVVLAAGLARRYGGCKPLAPIGPNGEAVIDLLVSDAVSVGFDRIVLVLHPETGPAIRYHVERCWPGEIEVAFTEQRLPLGTVHAVLASRSVVSADTPFAVCNADDVYGEKAMRLLRSQLSTDSDRHMLIGYHLRATVATDEPVTRGICEVDPQGSLVSLSERRSVTRIGDGSKFNAPDGLAPAVLDGDVPTSVNLWGFQPAIWEVLESAMATSDLDEATILAAVAAGGEVPKAEVLLPDVVATMVERKIGLPVRVILTDTRLIGVTHAADLPVVTAELARQVALGTRLARLWEPGG